MNDLDDRLIRVLQTDGRASFSDLAKKLGVTRSLATAKLNELTNSGELRIVAAVHPRVLGLNAVAHVSIQLSGSAGPALAKLSKLEGAVFASLTTGRYGIITELRLPTVPELYKQVEAIRATDGVAGVDVLMYKDVVRSLFLGKEPPSPDLELDQLDLKIMSELQLDGRMGFEMLGEKVGLSTSAARIRVLRLIDARVMQVGPVRSRSASSKSMAFGLGISTISGTEEVVDFFGRTPGLEFLATCFGRHDLVATVGVSSMDEMHETLDQVRALGSVANVETWLHLRIIQERYDRPLDKMLEAQTESDGYGHPRTA
ncbi:Lrp/AsnC family transcriptional regulator [Arthrobacter sp. MA-N2]|uniref:Lrp/AsnC family transcriptional regulator n=1 Tax=Arthrobacter sp. MA-N2 TaxID=1101188 RepID=UPI001E375F9C|nr:Lrp/AsnC family transcriptional regulator [Arthrobacter sp. MA-N2]